MWRAIFVASCALCSACAVDGGGDAAGPGDAGSSGGLEAGLRDFGVPDADFTGRIYAFSRIEANDAGPRSSYAVTAGFSETPTEVCVDRTPLLAPEGCTAMECYPRTPDPTDGGTRP